MSEEKRFRMMDEDDEALGDEKSRWSDGRMVIYDSAQGEVLGRDGGGPEDNRFYRSYSWVCPKLNELEGSRNKLEAKVNHLKETIRQISKELEPAMSLDLRYGCGDALAVMTVIKEREEWFIEERKRADTELPPDSGNIVYWSGFVNKGEED